jgi:diaminopimelate epimerase
VKAHGTGNDFVILADREDAVTLDRGLTRALCDRRTGLGGDGAIRIAPARASVEADVFMDYRNRDGSVAEMCGNGVRCVAKVVLDRHWVGGDRLRVDTRAGVKVVDVAARHADGRVAQVHVGMGRPVVGEPVELDISPLVEAPGPEAADDGADGGEALVTAEHRVLALTTVSLGNPHAVAVVEDVARAPLARWARLAAAHPAFVDGVNVEVVAAVDEHTVQGRVHERGVGETAASATGASAIAVAAARAGLAAPRVTVRLPGGELACDWRHDGVMLTGPAEVVATGHLDSGWLSARRDAEPDRDRPDHLPPMPAAS